MKTTKKPKTKHHLLVTWQGHTDDENSQYDLTEAEYEKAKADFVVEHFDEHGHSDDFDIKHGITENGSLSVSDMPNEEIKRIIKAHQGSSGIIRDHQMNALPTN